MAGHFAVALITPDGPNNQPQSHQRHHWALRIWLCSCFRRSSTKPFLLPLTESSLLSIKISHSFRIHSFICTIFVVFLCNISLHICRIYRRMLSKCSVEVLLLFDGRQVNKCDYGMRFCPTIQTGYLEARWFDGAINMYCLKRRDSQSIRTNQMPRFSVFGMVNLLKIVL